MTRQAFAAGFSWRCFCSAHTRSLWRSGIWCRPSRPSQMFAITIPCVVFMLRVELFVAPIMIALGRTSLRWPDWVEMLRVFVLPFAWIFFLAAVALTKVQGIHWLAGLAFAVVSIIPTGIIMAVFIR